MEICDTEFWKIELSSDQYYFGRCVVVLKRECSELSGLSEEEFLDLLKIIKKFEGGMKHEFGASMFNWTCLMNNAWKDANDEKPQVHFHVRPRYKENIEFDGVVFEDENFAHHYERKTDRDVGEEVMGKIVEKIRGMMNG